MINYIIAQQSNSCRLSQRKYDFDSLYRMSSDNVICAIFKIDSPLSIKAVERAELVERLFR